MEIGKKNLNDADFTDLWTTIYQELHLLASMKPCNAIVIFDAIYEVCTSSAQYEDKLYWKIGDFLYSRCKEHKAFIDAEKDYIKAYAERFMMYETLVRSLDLLGEFLNETIKGRKINDFGYLLWERCVIQNLSPGFYEDVYQYKNAQYCDKQKNIICSDYTIRMKILQSFSYIRPDISNPLLYYREKYENVAIQKIISKYKTISDIENIQQYAQSVFNAVNDERSRFHEYFLISSIINVERALSHCLLKAPNDIVERFKRFLVSTHADGTQHAYTKKLPANAKTGEEILSYRTIETIKHMIERPSSSSILCSNPVEMLVQQLGILDIGYSICKKAFAESIIDAININADVLRGPIEGVNRFYSSLNLVTSDADFVELLQCLFSMALQRVKPCFNTRLSTFSSNLASRELMSKSPYTDYYKIFLVMLELVSDKAEFLSVYQTELRERLISASTSLEDERHILNSMCISPDDKLFKMIDEADSRVAHGKGKVMMVNSLWWGMCQSQTIQSSVVSRFLPESLVLKKVLISTKYSSVDIKIGNSVVKMNILQYPIIDAIANKIPVNILDEGIKNQIPVLIKNGILIETREGYRINDVGADMDISQLYDDKMQQEDICADSYYQALSARILKRMQRATMKELMMELNKLSKFSLTQEKAKEVVLELLEKGLGEEKEGKIEYVA